MKNLHFALSRFLFSSTSPFFFAFERNDLHRCKRWMDSIDEFKEIYADTVGIKKLNDWFKLEK